MHMCQTALDVMASDEINEHELPVKHIHILHDVSPIIRVPKSRDSGLVVYTTSTGALRKKKC